MKRRSFFGALAAIPGLGFLAGKADGAPLPDHNQIAKAADVFKAVPLAKLRVWTLGDLDARLLPSPQAFQRLADVLRNWDGESTLDVIWGPDLKCQQFDLGCGPYTDTSRTTTEFEVGPDGVRKVVNQTIEIIKGPEPIQVEVAEEDGELVARLTLREPHIKVIRRSN